VQRAPSPDEMQTPQDWLALSGAGLLDASANAFDILQEFSFVAELRLPLPQSAVLINHQSHEGQHRSFGVFYDSGQGVSLLMRAGGNVLRAQLPLPQNLEGSTARLTFNIGPKQWSLHFSVLDSAQPSHCAAGAGYVPLALRDIHQLCLAGADGAHVLWFGFARGGDLPIAAPWIGLRTLIDTPNGPVPAGRLKAGDHVLTQDHGALVLRAVRQLNLPARGSFAPILLRGPYYDARGDVLVSADQRVVLAGAEVEYLFGTERVLAKAKDLVDGRSALAEDRRDIISAVSLDLGCDALIGAPSHAKGLLFAVGANAPNNNALPLLLTRYEAATLLRMMGRVVTKLA